MLRIYKRLHNRNKHVRFNDLIDSIEKLSAAKDSYANLETMQDSPCIKAYTKFVENLTQDDYGS